MPMSDAPSGSAASPDNPQPASASIPQRPPFPLVRLFYSVGYGFIAWFVLHIVFVLAVVQFVVIALNGRANEELKHFSLTLVQYLWELLATNNRFRSDRFQNTREQLVLIHSLMSE